jgi:sec-independent protein translocase protein TatA
MFGLGIGELVVILLVLVLLFGASKLPQLGAGLGEGIRNFRKAFREIHEGDQKLSPPRPEAPKPGATGSAEPRRQDPPSGKGQ